MQPINVRETWHMTCDTWHVMLWGEHFLKISVPYLLRFENKVFSNSNRSVTLVTVWNYCHYLSIVSYPPDEHKYACTHLRPWSNSFFGCIFSIKNIHNKAKSTQFQSPTLNCWNLLTNNAFKIALDFNLYKNSKFFFWPKFMVLPFIHFWT